MPISLNGSAQPIALGAGYVLHAPALRGSVDVQIGGTTATRSAMRGLDAGMDALDAALQASNVTEVRRIELNVQPVAGPAAAAATPLRSAQGEPEIELEVPDLGPESGQLLLSVDDAGALRWHLPESDAGAVPGTATRGAGAVKRFRIPATVLPPPPGATGLNQRSLFGTVGRRLLKVLVYPVTDPIIGPISAFFAKRWEEQKRPYRLRSFTPANYQSGDVPGIDVGELATMAAAGPVLLFVHGTFSTAHGGFGGLPAATLTELHQRYGERVIAFDHPTLADDPAANVRWLLSRWPAAASEVDIVCHSRGGLVSRVLAESPAGLGLDAARVNVRRIVFGASPNNGTVLTDPDHMVNMIDRFTTALALFPTGPVTETLEALVTVVKMLGHGALKGLDGLASMRPEGAFLTALNSAGTPSGEYFGVASNYEPTDRGLRALVSGAADNLADQIFGNAGNDLVVPTDGVYQRNGSARFPLPDDRLLRFAPTDGVMHTTLFEHPAVSQRLLDWLTA